MACSIVKKKKILLSSVERKNNDAQIKEKIKINITNNKEENLIIMNIIS